jgi:hypothetical protein
MHVPTVVPGDVVEMIFAANATGRFALGDVGLAGTKYKKPS